jgi:CO/xanthine dehydrogenase Mo-binding subunit
VRVVAGDTSQVAYAPVSGGSKITYTVGRAVERAAEQARERLLHVAASELEIAPEDLEIADGEVRPVGTTAGRRQVRCERTARGGHGTSTLATSSAGAYVESRSRAWRIPSPRMPASPREAPRTVHCRSSPLRLR